MEDVFGLMSLYEAKAILGMDVKKTFNLRPGVLQSMVSHEEISVPIKNKSTVTRRWEPTIAFAGNEWPTIWRDQLGALMDRVIFVSFLKKIDPTKKDTNIKRRVPLEIDAIIEKCILCYHEWLKRAVKDIGSVMPEKFIKARYIVREQGNPFEQFLSSSRVEILEPNNEKYNSYVTSESDIMDSFEAYCEKWKKKVNVDPSDIRGSLEGRNCRYEDTTVDYKSHYWLPESRDKKLQPIKTDFYFGIRIREKEQRMEMEKKKHGNKEEKKESKSSKKDKDGDAVLR
jgi:phage/plasmid-associated DNA primase